MDSSLSKRAFAALAFGLVPTASAALYDAPISTNYGLIQGYPAFNSSPTGVNLTNWQNIAVWKNIPFAATTAGDNRWKAPQPASPWNGTRDAKDYSNICPDSTTNAAYTVSEDCLNLNVWSAANSTDAKLPVVMWSYPAVSTARDGLFDGAGFADKGVVYVNYNGEADPSVPTPSSVHYWQSVLSIMYPDLSFNASVDALGEWYRFFLIPGAAHCGSNDLQPDGPFPDSLLDTMIEWVENGIFPERLNATVSAGTYTGEVQKLCPFPTRPYWPTNGTEMICEYDQASVDSWTYTLDAFDMPIY